MSLKTRFFNGVEYSALDWADYFKPLYSNGVLLKNENDLKVSFSIGMTLIVGNGLLFINGWQCESISSSLNVEITNSEPRIDRVVIRLDLDVVPQGIKLYVKQGNSEAAPILERTNNVYEMSLATISIPAGSANLSGAAIVDDRADPDLCGISLLYGQSSAGYPGEIKIFATGSIPSGVIVCDGGEVNRFTYASLFSRIGTKYGYGNGVNTFNVPDYRGAFLRGLDGAKGIDPGRALGTFQEGTLFGTRDGGAYQSGGDPGGTATINAGTTGNARLQDLIFTRPANYSVVYTIVY